MTGGQFGGCREMQLWTTSRHQQLSSDTINGWEGLTGGPTTAILQLTVQKPKSVYIHFLVPCKCLHYQHLYPPQVQHHCCKSHTFQDLSFGVGKGLDWLIQQQEACSSSFSRGKSSGPSTTTTNHACPLPPEEANRQPEGGHSVLVLP